LKKCIIIRRFNSTQPAEGEGSSKGVKVGNKDPPPQITTKGKTKKKKNSVYEWEPGFRRDEVKKSKNPQGRRKGPTERQREQSCGVIERKRRNALSLTQQGKKKLEEEGMGEPNTKALREKGSGGQLSLPKGRGARKNLKKNQALMPMPGCGITY